MGLVLLFYLFVSGGIFLILFYLEFHSLFFHFCYFREKMKVGGKEVERIWEDFQEGKGYDQNILYIKTKYLNNFKAKYMTNF